MIISIDFKSNKKTSFFIWRMFFIEEWFKECKCEQFIVLIWYYKNNWVQFLAMSQRINPQKLLSISLKLAEESCKIIKNSYMSKEVKKFWKAENDPVTEVTLHLSRPISKSKLCWTKDSKYISLNWKSSGKKKKSTRECSTLIIHIGTWSKFQTPSTSPKTMKHQRHVCGWIPWTTPEALLKDKLKQWPLSLACPMEARLS